MSTESDLGVGFGKPDTSSTAAGALLRAPGSADASGLPNPPAGVASHDRPDAPGWSSAATAIHAMRQVSAPMLLALEATGQPQLIVDFRHNAFAGEISFDRFPTSPESVGVQTQLVNASDPPLFDLPGRNLDALLWLIGLNSFAGAPAWWLPEDARYRMTRWPNLTELPYTPQQMRMIAMLGNAFLGPDELAAASGSPLPEAQRLLNALSLMGVLKSSSSAVAAIARTEPAAASRGLFRRLLDRMASRG